ncbi:21 kDa protein-like [Lolium rigidum]|uniref:21 kDa protein-like n=1 Tax=Lolium rigidum TaxID=89674 RepID=UPI001F5CADD0|nr:21 kDa protein-like [Lolium rigidum]
MRKRDLVLPCFLFLLAAAGSASASPVSPAVAAEFVRRSCRSTTFPRACERSLMPRAPAVGRSPRRLAHAALAVAAECARNASAYIGPPPKRGAGGGAMGDCAETARDAADLLRQAAAELGARNMGRASSPRFAWRLANAQTWASAALTDADTCLDSLATYSSGAPRDDVKRRVVAVEQATSNALALVNRLQPPRRRHQMLS